MKAKTRLLLWLKSFKGIGDVACHDIISENHLEQFNEKEVEKWMDQRGVFQSSIFQSKSKKSPNELEKEADEALKHVDEVEEQCQKNNLALISYFDSSYPMNLKGLRNAPVLLYVKGNISLLTAQKSIAIVGTRKPSLAGEKLSYRLSEYFTERKALIVSGLAIGIDVQAHQACLDHKGKTLAIVGHGLAEALYPKENQPLAKKILNGNGAILSTYEPTVPVQASLLAARDGWLSGISDGLIAVETAVDGGTRYAMDKALRYHRPIGMPEWEKLKRGRKAFLNEKNHDPSFKYHEDNLFSLANQKDLEAFEQLIRKKRNDRYQQLNKRQEDNQQLFLFD